MVKNQPTIGVLVVHGIGAQAPGETLAKLGDGLRRMFLNVPEKPAEGELVTLGDHSVRLYEVYWADLLEGERVRGTFNIDECLSLAWFPFFNQRYRAYAKEPYSLGKMLWYMLVLPPVGFLLLIFLFRLSCDREFIELLQYTTPTPRIGQVRKSGRESAR